MNIEISAKLLLLFFGVTSLVAIVAFVRAKGWRALVLRNCLSNWQPFAFTVLPLTGLLMAGKLCDLDTMESAPYFAIAALLTDVLNRIGLNSQLRSLLLLMASVALTLFASDSVQPAVAAAAGLIVWKIVENLSNKPSAQLADVTAPIIWLSAFCWSQTGLKDQNGSLCQSVVLSTFLVASFLRGLQPCLLDRDPTYMKRLMLCLTGWLAVLILSTKILMHASLGSTAMFAGAGFLCTYLFQSLDRRKGEGPSLPRTLTNILLVGILALVATRLFGMQGLLVLAAATTISEESGAALIAGLFLASRVLLQAYISQYNPNVTGINLMHNYSSAALYAGFLIAIVASLLIRHISKRSLLTMVYLAGAAIIPTAANYFLHAEPTAALLISVGVAGVLVTMLAPAIFPAQAANQENLILMPLLITLSALLSKDLLQTGDGAATQDRVIALGVIAGLIFLLALINRFALSSEKPGTSGSGAGVGAETGITVAGVPAS
jgi:hypothetical protein